MRRNPIRAVAGLAGLNAENAVGQKIRGGRAPGMAGGAGRLLEVFPECAVAGPDHGAPKLADVSQRRTVAAKVRERAEHEKHAIGLRLHDIPRGLETGRALVLSHPGRDHPHFHLLGIADLVQNAGNPAPGRQAEQDRIGVAQLPG